MGKLKNIDEALDQEEKLPYEITNASLKDMLCNYGYEIMTGPGTGDKIPNRKGSSIVHEDMIEAFKKLTVHLAIIDDAFKYSASGKKNNTLDFFDDHEITGLFSVTGFKVSGSEENEGFVIIGEKWVSHGSISLETPKISKSSNYPFYEELKEVISNCRSEVIEYMNGKAAPHLEQAAFDFKPELHDQQEQEQPF